MMVANDCGEIPVVESTQSRKLVGVITDRDIVCRAIAEARSPATTTVQNCMTKDVVTAKQDATLEEIRQLMEDHQIRRIPVVDDDSCCCGIVSQADIAVRGPADETGEMVREVSRH
jgi:CBS domain-containing protein